jgi:hypothetical protein
VSEPQICLACGWSTTVYASLVAHILLAHPEGAEETYTPVDRRACHSTRHCATHDFCHRCQPDLTVASRYLTKAVSAARIPDVQKGTAYAQLAAVILALAPPLAETAVPS